MYDRLAEVNVWLEWLGLKQRSNLELMLHRLTGLDTDTGALHVFASALEPVKGYERHRNHYGASSSFNRLVDAIPPESDRAREFRNAVDRYLGAPSPGEADRLRKELATWSESAARIRPQLENNSLLTEDLPLAEGLAALCKTGDEALSDASSAAPTDWKLRAAAAIKDSNAHHAGLLIAIAPAIQKLVEAVP